MQSGFTREQTSISRRMKNFSNLDSCFRVAQCKKTKQRDIFISVFPSCAFKKGSFIGLFEIIREEGPAPYIFTIPLSKNKETAIDAHFQVIQVVY